MVCSKGKQSSGLGEASLEYLGSCESKTTAVLVFLWIFSCLCHPLCIEYSEQRILWLEKSISFRKIPIFRISGASECLWVGTFRPCKIHMRPEKNLRYFSQNYIHNKHKWNHLSLTLLTCSEARIQWPHGNTRCIFIRCVPMSNVFFKLILSVPWTSHPVVELKLFCLGGSRRFKQIVFSECCSGLVSWKWSLGQSCLWYLLGDYFFCMPHVLQNTSTRWQFKFSASSSAHLAGATTIFSWRVNRQVSWIISHLKNWLDFGCLSKMLYLCYCLCKTIWNVDKLDYVHWLCS